MYRFLHDLLSDQKGGEIFTCFGVWHLGYIAITAAVIVAVLYFFRKRSESDSQKLLYPWICAAFGLYIADFFLMPLAYGEIDIEKLPFHACTVTCVLGFLSYHNRFLKKYRTSLTLLGFICNLVYLLYPAGVMWHAVHPLSYRVVQTLLFHSVMTVYGALALVYDREKFCAKTLCRDLSVLASTILWALLGNTVYNGTADGYSHFFNWFFVVRDPFYAIDETIAPFLMPFLNIAVFFAVELILRAIFATRSPQKEQLHADPRNTCEEKSTQ